AAALATRARRALARPRRSRVLADVRPAPDLAHAPPRGRRGRSFFFMFSPAPGRARAPRRLRRERGAHSHGPGAVAFSATSAPHRISPHATHVGAGRDRLPQLLAKAPVRRSRHTLSAIGPELTRPLLGRDRRRGCELALRGVELGLLVPALAIELVAHDLTRLARVGVRDRRALGGMLARLRARAIAAGRDLAQHGLVARSMIVRGLA